MPNFWKWSVNVLVLVPGSGSKTSLTRWISRYLIKTSYLDPASSSAASVLMMNRQLKFCLLSIHSYLLQIVTWCGRHIEIEESTLWRQFCEDFTLWRQFCVESTLWRQFCEESTLWRPHCIVETIWCGDNFVCRFKLSPGKSLSLHLQLFSLSAARL